MKFFATALVFAAAVLAKPKLLNSAFDIEEGQPFTFKWDNAQGPVTITLVTGQSKDLKPVTTITTGETGTSYTWTPSDLPSGTYAIQIDDASGEPNYSVPFTYQGTGETPTSTDASSTVERTSTATSTSASSTTSEESSTTSSSVTSTETETKSSSTTSSEASTSTTLSTSTTTQTPSTTREAPTGTNSPPDLNNGQRFASPLGFVLVTVAALIFFN
ncbi:Ser-Thr-rich glycosyl-phosphatidyl-inositol-anchored membrane family-domain-containing protein [Dichotomopilus funicola]|uniref:Ser-Thr-rich glycosyl-phosphatidyl-inositol-anchored membrane family-domain-containing protein n=1 Tax=Dichotomopilus funicola TaxID=1934379 RepID=A0AAN6V645_9PEZI|nr:Ser-Thr-rich glycosyl-phosphatidyl-inositol-anchored membrane family-domain-containing protein [Dichotomopilus funicola]